MKFHSSLFSLLIGAVIPSVLSSRIDVFPNVVNNVSSVAQFTAGLSGFDGPKVDVLNGTSYDWWYFDAVSSTTNASIVIVFYVATSDGFLFLNSGSGIFFNVFATFDNGTSPPYALLAGSPGVAGEATVVTTDEGSSGYWNSSGAYWVGDPLLSTYVINVSSPAIDVYGTFVLNSVAPAHYPCGLVEPGANLEVSPNIGWANAVPDADAVVDFTIGGEKLQFTGVGYHDKNWGVVPFDENVYSWYWGHGRLGPYAIVWFDILGADGNEYLSSYASLDGVIVASSCSGIKVRPTGNNSQYPPVSSTGNPDGFHIDLDLPDGKVLSVNVTTEVVTLDIGIYGRYTGTLEGGIEGDSITYTGVGLYEEFKLGS